MNRSITIFFGIVFCLVVTAVAQEKPYVVSPGGNKVTGTEIEVDAAGNITLKTESGEVSFDRGNYKRAYKPRPRKIEQVYKKFQNEKYNEVIKYSPQLMEKYKYLGWGDMIAYMHGMALVRKGKAEDALQVIERGKNFARNYEDLLIKAEAQALGKAGEMEKAVKRLNELIKEGDGETAAFAFNTKGNIKVDRGKKKEAALEYLKTVLLFKPGEAKEHRQEAKKKAVKLLEEMNDPRAEKIRKLD